jgi:hypothetical protein
MGNDAGGDAAGADGEDICRGKEWDMRWLSDPDLMVKDSNMSFWGSEGGGAAGSDRLSEAVEEMRCGIRVCG